MAKPGLVTLGALLIAAGGAAVGYGVTRKPTGGMSPQASAAMTAAVSALDGDVKAARASVHERAGTLATLQQVQGAVGTDVQTARDMLEHGELNFSPQPGEVIELGQLPEGKPPTTLVVQPEGSMHTSHAGTPGSFAELMNDTLAITDVAAVKPKEGGAPIPGYISVSRPLALGPAIDKLVAAGVTGQFEIGGKTRAIGTPPANATPRAMPLPSQPDFQLVVAVPAAVGGMPVPLVAGGAGAAAIGLLLLLVGLMTGRTRAAAATATAAQTLALAQTQMSQSGMAVATGTPAPLDTTSAAVEPANLGPGAMVGRWEIIKRLGSGGMADVYLARARGDAGFEKLVAVKVMHPHLARNQRAVDHFLDEARLAAGIVHPNVVAIQDLGKIGNDYVIVMEYVDGIDLERLLMSAREAARPVPVDVALAILCRICDGLNAAHRALASDGTPLNLVHRDVKAANVLVSKQGGVKVVDFGIAKAANQVHNTVAGETKGTPSMMAPEQRIGEHVDVRADVYAVGAVAYEVLTGQGVNLDLAALAHLGVENWPHLPPPSSLRPQLPAELDGIVMKAMSFEREKRPADCAAFEAMFERVMKQHGMAVSDKDIGRWVVSEVALLSKGTPAELAPTSAPVG